ncbi:MAG: serine hydrolase [Bacteroidota bacterium]
MKSIKIPCGVLLVFLFVNVGCRNQGSTDQKVVISEEKIEKVNFFIEEMIQLQKIPGISLSILSADTIVNIFKGKSDLDLKNPISENTIFPNGSISEVLVAIGVMRLVEMGKLSLDDPLITHLPYFHLNGDGDHEKITIRMLLTHSSGLPNLSTYWDSSSKNDSALEVTTRSVRELELEFEPGTKHQKTFLDFDIAADLIAKASGMSFHAFMKTEVLEPLGMSQSFFELNEYNQSQLTRGHAFNSFADSIPSPYNYYPYNPEHAGSHGLQTNPSDLSGFISLLMNEGRSGKKTVISPSLTKEYLRKQYKLNDGLYSALGWEISTAGPTDVYHTEYNEDGYAAVMLYAPDQSLGIVLNSNLTLDYRPYEVAENILFYLAGYSESLPEIKIPVSKPMAGIYDHHGLDSALSYYINLVEEDIERYDKSINSLNLLVSHLFSVATEENKEQKKEDILKTLDFIHTNFPKSPQPHISSAEAYMIMGDSLQAVKSMDAALSVGEDDPSLEMRVQAMKEQLANNWRVSFFQ